MIKHHKNNVIFSIILLVSATFNKSYCDDSGVYVSAIGDPGMRRDGLRVAIESWNQCNEVGEETPFFGSPRAADCFDLLGNNNSYKINHKINEDDNKLGLGTPIPGKNPTLYNNVDLYAPQKELYLAKKCLVQDRPNPWHFWMIMLKNGNLDTYAGKCPKDGVKVGPFDPAGRFDCFGEGCMRHPTMYHNYTELAGERTLRGGFFGTWDIDNGLEDENESFYSVVWEKQVGSNESWVFSHILRTSKKFPWLMLYLRSDAIKGFSGGYHYDTRGMIKTTNLKSPNFKVKFTLNVTKGGGKKTQFYLVDMGSCWKNNGQSCNGDVTSDVTRYSEMIINPDVDSWCTPNQLDLCPPYHTFSDGSIVLRNDTVNFPYAAYHLYCAPGNGLYLEQPARICDPFSNPQAQEIVQILPHPVWGKYGYPTKKGEGWIGDPKDWFLDVGRMSQNLYFYQDPGTKPIKRKWSSIDLGVEVYRDPNQVVEWTVSDFDIIIPSESRSTKTRLETERISTRQDFLGI